MIKIDCKAPEGNAYVIMAQVNQILHDNNVPEDVIEKIMANLMSSASYWELLDAAITITEGEIEFINIPERH
jgi:hypothetical protein